MSPLVSIVMAVHNGEQFIREAIDSILEQTFKDFEFIIIDDGSTDSTPSLLEEYRHHDKRIRVNRFDQNQGLTICLNTGIQLALGKYIARMDADDVSLSHRLEEQVKFLDVHPEITVLGTGFTLMDETGRHLKDYIFSTHPEVLKWQLLFSTPIGHPTVMMRSETIKILGGYDPKLIRAQDYDLWWRVGFIGKLGNLEDIHLLLRQHQGRVTNKEQNQQTDSARNICKKYISIVLDRDIPRGIIDNVKGKQTTARSAAMTGGIILDYYYYCVQSISASIRLIIMRQALERTVRKVARFFVFPVTWPIWARLFFLLFQFFVTKIEVLLFK